MTHRLKFLEGVSLLLAAGIGLSVGGENWILAGVLLAALTLLQFGPWAEPKDD